MSNFLSIFIFILWLLLGWWYYKDHNACCQNTDSVSAVVEPAKQLGPLVFNYANANAITSEGWPKYKEEIIAKRGADQSLEIIGYYRANEKNDSKFENLGLARANEVRKLFPEIPDDKISLVGKLIDGDIADKGSPFESAAFEYKVNTKEIKEIDDKVLIYFPYNSTNKINSTEIEKYLDDVAERVNKSGERVNLTGHTDSDGSDAANQSLGQRRADIIKAYLVSKGVKAENITASSQGEKQPISDNTTDEGKAQNRRTELQIIK